MDTVNDILYRTSVVPVIKLDSDKQAVPLAKALLKGGIGAAEITFRTPAAARSIAAVSEALPEMFVCAGTVLTVEQAKLAAACGARAIVSPGTNPKVVEWCRENHIPVYPGCATPTEVEAALALGLTELKLFPAEAIGGVKLLKALYGPYSHVRFMPTGGISPQNLKDYLTLPNVLACGGSWLCPEDALAQEDWGQIEALARACSEQAAAIRQGNSKT